MSGTTMGMDPSLGGMSDEGYDSSVHENQIVAVYRDHAQAQAAKDALVGAGVSAGAIQVVDREGSRVSSGSIEEGGFWGAIKSLFAPDEDAHAYSHAVGEGHAIIVVTPGPSMDRNHIIQVLESTDPIDFDAKMAEWQQSGYDYSRPHSAAYGASETMGGTVSAATAGVGTSMAAETPPAMAPVTPVVPMATTTPMAPAIAAGDQDTIKIMEERLRVGKREVAQGAVRIRSYVVERPVEEQVRLREERITVDRRPVDREVTPGELGAFQERTIEASGYAEEAVVSKEARVVEEIGLHKEASERVETVRDTVRKTEVEVEDGTKTMGTGGTVTNATPGATTSGANSPRK